MINKLGKFYLPSIISFALGLLSAAVLTRVFSQEIYGVLNVFNNTVALVVTISYLGMDAAYIRFYNETPTDMNKEDLFWGLTGLSVGILSTVSMVIVVFFSDLFMQYVFEFKSTIVCVALFVNAMSQIVVRFFTISYRMDMDTRMYSVIVVLTQIATKFFVVLSAMFTQNILLILLLNTVGILLVMLFVFIINRNNIFKPKRMMASVRNITKKSDVMKFAFCSAPIPVLTTLSTFIAQRIIVYRFGMDAVGLYSSANYFTSVFIVLQSGFATFWAAYVFANYKEKQATIAYVHDILTFVVIAVYAGFILFRDVVYLVIGQEYYESIYFFSIVIVYPMLTLLVETTGYGIQIKKKNHIALAIYFVTFIANIVTSIILSKYIGLKGVAMGTALSGIVNYFLSTVFGQKYYKTINNKYKSIIGFILFIMMLICSGFFPQNYINMSVGVLVVLAGLLYYKEIGYGCKCVWNEYKKRR